MSGRLQRPRPSVDDAARDASTAAKPPRITVEVERAIDPVARERLVETLLELLDGTIRSGRA